MQPSVVGPRIVEPRLGRVGVARAFQAVGLGLLASAGASLIGVLALALGGLGPAADALARAAALGPLATGLGGGLLAALCVTAAAVGSPRVLRYELSGHPHHAPSLEGLALLEVGGLRIVWGVALLIPGLLVAIFGWSQWAQGRSMAMGVVALVGTAILVTAVLLLRGALDANTRWKTVVEPMVAEHGRRVAAAVAADGNRHAQMPVGTGPPTTCWRAWVRLGREAQRTTLVLLTAMLLLGAIGRVARLLDGLPQWLASATALSVAIPTVLLVLMLAAATIVLVVAEAGTGAWAAQAREQVPDTQAVARALHGRRASWYGALTLGLVAGLLVTVTFGVVGTADSVPAAAELAPPPTLIAVAATAGGAGLLWALADLPRTRVMRERVRAACAPGDLSPAQDDDSGARRTRRGPGPRRPPASRAG